MLTAAIQSLLMTRMSEEQIATVSKMCLKALAYLHSQVSHVFAVLLSYFANKKVFLFSELHF